MEPGSKATHFYRGAKRWMPANVMTLNESVEPQSEIHSILTQLGAIRPHPKNIISDCRALNVFIYSTWSDRHTHSYLPTACSLSQQQYNLNGSTLNHFPWMPIEIIIPYFTLTNHGLSFPHRPSISRPLPPCSPPLAPALRVLAILSFGCIAKLFILFQLDGQKLS